MLSSKTFFPSEGYSLVELIITLVLTSIVMVILFGALGNAQKSSVSSVHQVKAAILGQAYLDEISAKRFAENSPIGNGLRCNDPSSVPCSAIEIGETRASFDDVDDYNGIDNEAPTDASGNLRAGFNNFKVSVTVVDAGSDAFGSTVDGLLLADLKKITVTVTAPDGGSFIFSQYKGNF